jgi:type IV pilus assembly protein PilV
VKTRTSGQRGILLLESLIAILIISFGVLGLVALWANSVRNASEAKYRTDAAYLANEMISQMWLTRPVTAAFTKPTAWTTRVAAALPNGTVDVAMDDDPDGQLQATITIGWQATPASATHSYMAIAHINSAGPI